MRTDQTWLKRVAGAGLALMAGASMSACGSGSTKWKEEVQLSDGRIIVVERQTIRESGGDEWTFNRSGTKPTEYRIRFEYPDGSGKLVEWWSIKKSPRTWPEIPLVLDVETGRPVVFSSVFNSGGCHLYSKYLYQNDAWVEEKLSQKFEQRATNLLIFDDKDMQHLISLETKNKQNTDSHTQGFRRVGPIHPYCK